MSRDERPTAPPVTWTVVASETVVDSPWLRVRRQHIRTVQGFELPEYYLLDTQDIAVLLPLTETGQAVLVRQYRHGAGREVLELPAGLIDPGDASPSHAAARELLEETGYEAASLEPLGTVLPSPSRQTNRAHCFLATGCRRVTEPGGDPAERIEVELLGLDDLRAAVRRGDFPSQLSLSCLLLGLERMRRYSG